MILEVISGCLGKEFGVSSLDLKHSNGVALAHMLFLMFACGTVQCNTPHSSQEPNQKAIVGTKRNNQLEETQRTCVFTELMRNKHSLIFLRWAHTSQRDHREAPLIVKTGKPQTVGDFQPVLWKGPGTVEVSHRLRDWARGPVSREAGGKGKNKPVHPDLRIGLLRLPLQVEAEILGAGLSVLRLPSAQGKEAAGDAWGTSHSKVLSFNPLAHI